MRAIVLSIALTLGLGGAALACGGYTLPMGALRLPYDPAVWTAAQAGPGHWRLTPRDADEGAAVDVTVGTGACTEAAMVARLGRQGGDRTGRRTNRSGLQVVWAQGYTGCRNLTAAPVAACVRFKGRTWVFQTAPRGCTLTRYGKADPMVLLDAVQRNDGKPAARCGR